MRFRICVEVNPPKQIRDLEWKLRRLRAGLYVLPPGLTLERMEASLEEEIAYWREKIH